MAEVLRKHVHLKLTILIYFHVLQSIRIDMEINLLLQIKLNIENRSNKQDYITGNKFLGDMGNKWKMKIIQ